MDAQRLDEVNRTGWKDEELAQVMSLRRLNPDLSIVLVSYAVQGVEDAFCYVVNINFTSRVMEVIKKHDLRQRGDTVRKYLLRDSADTLLV